MLFSLGLLWGADNYFSNLDCAALRAMTGTEGDSAVMLFGSFLQLLKLCGAIQNFGRSSFWNYLSEPNVPMVLLNSHCLVFKTLKFQSYFNSHLKTAIK